MSGFDLAKWAQHYQLLLTVVIGALAWLMGKAWELQTARRLRYAEIAALLAGFARGGNAAGRDTLDGELAKLWVDAPTPVVLASEAVRARLGDADGRDARIRALVIAMRRDTALWAWLSARRRHPLRPEQIGLSGDRREPG